MTNFFMMIRKQTTNATIIREMSRKIAQLSAQAIDSAATGIRKMRVNTDKIIYTSDSRKAVKSTLAKGAYIPEHSATAGDLVGWFRPEKVVATDFSDTGLSAAVGAEVDYNAPGWNFPATGATNEVIVTDNAAIRVSAAFTQSARIFLTDLSTDTSARVLWGKADDANNGYMVWVLDTGVLRVYVKSGGVNSTAQISGVTVNTVHHIAFSFNAGTITVYLDGVSSTTAGGTGTFPTAADLYIGSKGAASARTKGSIWDWRMYDAVLNSTAIGNIRNGGSRYGNAGIINLCGVDA